MNITKLSKQFGVDFEGCKDEALSLLMRIDSRRQKKKRDCSAGSAPDLKSKGQKQLTGLISSIKYKDGQPRSRGRDNLKVN